MSWPSSSSTGTAPLKRVGDPCLNNAETYRGWRIQQYWSDWDNGCINGDQPPLMPRSFQTLDGDQHIFVLGTDGNLWLEKPPFGNPPPSRQHVDGNAFTFQALDNQTVLTLGTRRQLVAGARPIRERPPNREQVDGSVQAFQGLNSQTVFVQGMDGNLWLESGPFGHMPPPRVQVDGNVKGFAAVDENHAFVLGTDGKLWLEEGPFGHVPPNRQLVATDVRGFRAQAVWAWVWVLDKERNLWLYESPFDGNLQQVDGNVLAFQPLDINHVAVLGTDARWQAPAVRRFQRRSGAGTGRQAKSAPGRRRAGCGPSATFRGRGSSSISTTSKRSGDAPRRELPYLGHGSNRFGSGSRLSI